jgi:hypothetical protein
MRARLIAAGIVIGLSSVSPAWAAERGAAQRDVEDYAIAACFNSQADPFVKDQGDAMASAILQRGHGAIETLGAVADAVKREIAKSDIPVAHNEVTGDKPMSLLYCTDIIDRASVRKAIAIAIARLAPAYRRQ